MLARLICLVNIMTINVLSEKKILHVSDENIAAATADVVLAVEKNTRRVAIANGTCVSFCTFWPPLGTPWDNRGKMSHGWKEDSMLVKRIVIAYTHLSSTVYEL